MKFKDSNMKKNKELERPKLVGLPIERVTHIVFVPYLLVAQQIGWNWEWHSVPSSHFVTTILVNSFSSQIFWMVHCINMKVKAETPASAAIWSLAWFAAIPYACMSNSLC